jgi:hypothetical protein
MAPLTGPVGPGTVWPTASTVTSSTTIPGAFSGRYAAPTAGAAGMIIAAGPSLSASQVPSVSATTPLS